MYIKEDYFLKDGHLNDQTISLIIDELKGSRPTQFPKEVDDHIENCIYCKDKIMDIFSAILTIPDKNNLDFKFHNKTALKQKPAGYNFLKIAASLILAILLSIIYISIKPEHRKKPHIINDPKSGPIEYNRSIGSSKASDKIPDKGDKNLKRFENNPNLESMINGKERSMMSIKGPFYASVGKDDIIRFRWGKINSDELNLTITDNSNYTLFSFEVTGNKFNLNKKLLPGLYYWKLSDKNNLYYVGKFLIRPESISRKE